jgi:hypothetical protein
LLALAAIYEGATRTEASRIGGVTLQIVRDWALKFNARGPDGLIDRKAPGPKPRLNDERRAALKAIIESGPIPAVHGVARLPTGRLAVDQSFRAERVELDHPVADDLQRAIACRSQPPTPLPRWPEPNRPTWRRSSAQPTPSRLRLAARRQTRAAEAGHHPAAFAAARS